MMKIMSCIDSKCFTKISQPALRFHTMFLFFHFFLVSSFSFLISPAIHFLVGNMKSYFLWIFILIVEYRIDCVNINCKLAVYLFICKQVCVMHFFSSPISRFSSSYFEIHLMIFFLLFNLLRYTDGFSTKTTEKNYKKRANFHHEYSTMSRKVIFLVFTVILVVVGIVVALILCRVMNVCITYALQSTLHCNFAMNISAWNFL